MRKLRSRTLFTLFSIAALGLWVGCGGDDDVTIGGTDAGTDTAVTHTTPPAETTPDTGPGDIDSGPDRDSGTPTFLDGGPEFDGGIPCYVGGAVEIEPNDTLAEANDFPDGTVSANVLKRVLCGAAYNPSYVDGGPADAGDYDWMQFSLGDASTDFYVRYEGNVNVTVETDGEAPVDITQQGASIHTFSKTQPYFVRVRSNDGRTQTWKIIVFQDQK